MKNTISPLLTLCLLAVPATGAIAGDFDAAAYHDGNCTRCHDSGVYTRENRRVRSLPKLEVQVARCDSMLQTQLFPDDLSALVDHLNTQYYHFGK